MRPNLYDDKFEFFLNNLNNHSVIESWFTKHDCQSERFFSEALSNIEIAIKNKKNNDAKIFTALLLSSIKEEEKKNQIIKAIGDLFFSNDEFNLAKVYYKHLSCIDDHFKSYIDVLYNDAKIEEIISIHQGLQDDSRRKFAQCTIHQIILKLVNDSVILDQHNKRYATNLSYLKKIDPYTYEKILKENNFNPFFIYSIKLENQIYYKDLNTWHKINIEEQDNLYWKTIFNHKDFFSKNNCLNCDNIIEFNNFIKSMHSDSPIFMKNYSYVLIDFNLLHASLFVLNFSPLLKTDKVLRFINKENIENSFEYLFIDKNHFFPDITFFNDDEKHQKLSAYITKLNVQYAKKVVNETKKICDEILKFYPPDFPLTIKEKLKNKTARILFTTSKSTTYLQYCIRDIAEGFNQLGCQTHIIIEAEHDATGIRLDISLKQILDFKPDIIFFMCHVRYEDSMSNPNIPAVTWVQDLLSPIASGRHLSQMTKNDIMLTEIYTPEALMAIGYKDVHHFPVHINDRIFNGNPENVQYDCDISHVSHSPSTNPFYPNSYPELTDLLFQIISKIITEPFGENYNLVTLDDFIKLLEPFIVVSGQKEVIYRAIRSVIANYICKTTVLKWIIDAGYTKIDLWGRGWSEMNEFSPFARGVVAHGTDLSRSYNKSKINLNLTHGATMHHKVFEVIASGGFLMTGYIAPEKDEYRIEQYLAPGEGYIFFKGKDDLLEKIDYYLKNDEERIKIIKRGMDKVLQHYSVKSGAQKVLDIVYNRFFSNNLAS